jgi:hypothetical protein
VKEKFQISAADATPPAMDEELIISTMKKFIVEKSAGGGPLGIKVCLIL